MNQDEEMAPPEYPGCLGCGYYRGGRCDAFPDRIPLAIISGELDHLTVRPGQVGTIVFTHLDFEVWKRTRQRVPLNRPPVQQPA
jgi:hypothetical protein